MTLNLIKIKFPHCPLLLILDSTCTRSWPFRLVHPVAVNQDEMESVSYVCPSSGSIELFCVTKQLRNECFGRRVRASVQHACGCGRFPLPWRRTAAVPWKQTAFQHACGCGRCVGYTVHTAAFQHACGCGWRRFAAASGSARNPCRVYPMVRLEMWVHY